MKKLICILIFFIIFSVEVSASSEEYFDGMLDEVENEIQIALESIGIENGTYEELLNIDFNAVIEQLITLFKTEMQYPLQVCASCILLMVVFSLVKSMIVSTDTSSQVFVCIEAVVFSFSLLVPIGACISAVISVCNATHNFIKFLIPVFAGIITASGKPTLAICLQTTSFGTAQILAGLFRTSLPVVAVGSSVLTVCGEISPLISTDRIVALIRKGYTSFLTFCSVLFSSLLSVKSVIATSADTVAVKGIKFVVGNAVPVVGGALSEALNSVISGIGLLRSTVGIFAILILILINLPTLIELVVWMVSLKLLNAFCCLLGHEDKSNLIASFDGLFGLMIAVVVYQAFLYIICITLMIVVAGMV